MASRTPSAALALHGVAPLTDGSARRPPWKICTIATAPRWRTAPASVVRPGSSASSKMPSSPGQPWPSFATCAAQVMTRPKPPSAREESQRSSSSPSEPSAWLCLLVIGASTTRLRAASPVRKVRGSKRLKAQGLPRSRARQPDERVERSAQRAASAGSAAMPAASRRRPSSGTTMTLARHERGGHRAQRLGECGVRDDRARRRVQQADRFAHHLGVAHQPVERVLQRARHAVRVLGAANEERVGRGDPRAQVAHRLRRRAAFGVEIGIEVRQPRRARRRNRRSTRPARRAPPRAAARYCSTAPAGSRKSRGFSLLAGRA